MNLSKQNMENRKIRVAITHGDTNGIGYEMIFKAFAEPAMLELCTPIIYGSPKIAAYHRNILDIQANFTIINNAEDIHDNKLNLLTAFDNDIKVDMGQPAQDASKAAVTVLERAVEDYEKGLFDVLVTSPMNFDGKQENGNGITGYSEYLERKSADDSKSLSILVKESLRIGLATTRIPLSEAVKSITKDLIENSVKTFAVSLKRDFRISNPRIAVLAINPKNDSNGQFGTEEQEIIIPVISELAENGINVFGPYASEDIFEEGGYTAFDGVLAMYYEQGKTPFKLLAEDDGIEFTTGLPIIHTATTYGACYDIAGQGVADENSLRNAIYLAIDVYRNRNEYEKPFANPLKKLYHDKRDESDKVRFAISKKKE